MNLEEICFRKNNTYDEKELIFTLEEYIFLRKNVKVKINPLARIPNHPMMLQIQYSKLLEAFNFAINWLTLNHFKK